MAPLLSIITITYRDPQALAATLASLMPLLESGLAWEQIVVDSSPEASAPALVPYLDRLPIRHIVQPAAGIYPAMNAGIRASKGPLIWFLNSGDTLVSAPNLQMVLDDLEKHPLAGMALATVKLTREGEFLRTQHPRTGIRPLLGINRVCHQAIVFRRSLIEQLGEFSEGYRLASDYELLLRARAAGAITLPSDHPIAWYDMGGQSSSTNLMLKEFRRVHCDLRGKDLLEHAYWHSIFWNWERIRIPVIQWLGNSTLGPILRKFRRILMSD